MLSFQCYLAYFLLIRKSYSVIYSFSFSLFLKVFCNSITNIENTKLRLALVIQTGAQITVANETVEIPSLAADKTNKFLVKIIKGCNIFTKCVTHCFFSMTFKNMIVFYFIDLNKSKTYAIV